MTLVHIFIPLMLQKPSRKSKAKDHVKYLSTRLEKWSKGDLKGLMSEGKEIQKRLARSQTQKAEAKEKTFCRLMFLGKVGQACKFVNNDDCVKAVHKITESVKQALAAKHPEGQVLYPEALLEITRTTPHPVIFEQITADTIQKCSKELSGSGGPTLIDADSWKHFTCS